PRRKTTPPCATGASPLGASGAPRAATASRATRANASASTARPPRFLRSARDCWACAPGATEDLSRPTPRNPMTEPTADLRAQLLELMMPDLRFWAEDDHPGAPPLLRLPPALRAVL